MKELVVLSGKGGTGKTSLVGCLAFLNEKSVLVDCDVDASNLHMILESEIRQRHEFVAGKKAHIDPAVCSGCGICGDHCRFGAIDEQDGLFSVNDIACEGCGVCGHVCPEEAVTMADNIGGQWFESLGPLGPFMHGELGIGQGNSGKLVSLLRQRAREVGRESGLPLIIVDGPPGIGCPVIASLSGADYALIVTEPSPTAHHDMSRLLQLTGHFHIRTGVCVNKYDLNETVAEAIEAEARQVGADVLGRISYDPSFTQAQKTATTVLGFVQNQATDEIRAIWKKLSPLITATATDGSLDACKNCGLLSVRPPEFFSKGS